MKNLRVVCAAVLLSWMAWAEPTAVTKAQAQEAIAHFFAHPSGKMPNPDLAAVLQFSQSSDQVDVKIDEAVLPWVREPKRDETAVLLGAYLAGNVEAQLNAGRKGDQARAGLTRAFQVYEVLHKEHPDFTSPGLLKLKELDAQGKLDDYLKKNHKA